MCNIFYALLCTKLKNTIKLLYKCHLKKKRTLRSAPAVLLVSESQTKLCSSCTFNILTWAPQSLTLGHPTDVNTLNTLCNTNDHVHGLEQEKDPPCSVVLAPICLLIGWLSSQYKWDRMFQDILNFIYRQQNLQTRKKNVHVHNEEKQFSALYVVHTVSINYTSSSTLWAILYPFSLVQH